MDLSYPEAVDVLTRRGQGIRPDLTRIAALVDLLDHPQRTFPAIHVAGTNGKSSTARMIGSILAAHGLAAGVYTSPHLQSVRERYLLGGRTPDEPGSPDARPPPLTGIISRSDFAAVVSYLVPFVDLVESRSGETVTYFELATAIAFEWMASASVAAGVIETGMGGSWDATNVADAEVAVLTKVGVDHTEFLGATPAEIAREKAGIVKPGARVVSAAQEPEVTAVIDEAVRRQGATLIALGRDVRMRGDRVAVGGRLVTIEGSLGVYEDLYLPLHGAHQSTNLVLAAAACEQFLGRPLDAAAVRAGLSLVECPGRMEVVGRSPLVVLDGAHNPGGAGVLGPALDEAFGRHRRIFVVSILADKDAGGMLERLLPYADRVIYTRSANRRAADPSALASLGAAAGVPAEVVPTLAGAVEAGISAARPDGMVVVTGSLYAVGEARDLLVGPVD